MQNDRLRTALGFAAKAGKCISGDFGAERAVKDKKALIIALDNGVSAATRERYEGMCQRARHTLRVSRRPWQGDRKG